LRIRRRLAVWLEAAGTARISARGTEFEFYGQALQAAVDGLGIAMGIRPYIDDDLAAGRLVAPFALSVPKGMRWYLVYRGFRLQGSAILPHSGAGLSAQRRSPRSAAGATDMPDEKIETLVIGGGQAGLVMSHQLKERGLSHLVLERQRIAERWRSERLGRTEIPVSQLVGAAAGLSVSAQRSGCLCGQRRHHQIHRGLCGLVAPPIRCGVAVTRLSQQRRRQRFRRRNHCRHDRGGQCRRRHRSLSAQPRPGPAGRSSRVPGPCRRLQNPDSFRRARAGRRRRRVGAQMPRNCCRPAAASISRSEGTAACRAATAAAT
jgi:hypothetical protein